MARLFALTATCILDGSVRQLALTSKSLFNRSLRCSYPILAHSSQNQHSAQNESTASSNPLSPNSTFVYLQNLDITQQSILLQLNLNNTSNSNSAFKRNKLNPNNDNGLLFLQILQRGEQHWICSPSKQIRIRRKKQLLSRLPPKRPSGLRYFCPG